MISRERVCNPFAFQTVCHQSVSFVCFFLRIDYIPPTVDYIPQQVADYIQCFALIYYRFYAIIHIKGDGFMKKFKKYIYPIAFGAIFLILFPSFMLLLNKLISFPHGSYAPAAWAVLFTLAWLILALPIYCIRYSKIIVDEKLKFLFSTYNSLLIIVLHILPFNLQGETTIIVLFILWVLFWNIVPLICRLISRKHEEKDIEK